MRPAVLALLLAPAFLLALAPANASASCGDYVTNRAQRALHASMAMAAHRAPIGDPGRVPCSGPTCSGRRSLPDATGPAGAPISPPEPCCDTAPVVLHRAPDGVLDPSDAPLHWPGDHRAGLSRPPRGPDGRPSA